MGQGMCETMLSVINVLPVDNRSLSLKKTASRDEFIYLFQMAYDRAEFPLSQSMLIELCGRRFVAHRPELIGNCTQLRILLLEIRDHLRHLGQFLKCHAGSCRVVQ